MMSTFPGAGCRARPGTAVSTVARYSTRVRHLTCKYLRPAILQKTGVRGDVVCDAHAQHPPKEGLIKDAEDKDACGVGFVGELTKQPTRKCITDALGMLVRMTHRGACGCEENTGVNLNVQGSAKSTWHS
jgi:hypothetical protein